MTLQEFDDLVVRFCEDREWLASVRLRCVNERGDLDGQKLRATGRAGLAALPFANLCSYCGAEVVGEWLTYVPNARVWDHVEGQSFRPPDPTICVPACWTCNSSKGALPLLFWLLKKRAPTLQCQCGHRHRCMASRGAH